MFSALEGLTIAAPGLGPYVVPMAVAILVILFAIHSQGTARIAHAFRQPRRSRAREPPSPGGHGFEMPNSLFARTAHIGLPADEVHESGSQLSATYVLSNVGACSPAVPISDHDV